ncbi:hypothetical protein BDV26DRAFT_216307 [Aspergillus bertholletiae]|uniref:Uncharacterized protein n=1 Tax=Aspergillus bertholletiae TaxID=1226010 RepID=A0A5N7B5F8_9EURO|nr:hypothetical protein BDV26DRAFT_216307 [Aspergillus bertholletiae]
MTVARVKNPFLALIATVRRILPPGTNLHITSDVMAGWFDRIQHTLEKTSDDDRELMLVGARDIIIIMKDLVERTVYEVTQSESNAPQGQRVTNQMPQNNARPVRRPPNIY